MVNIRDIKRKARRALHQRMRVAALHIPANGGTPLPVHVRVHSKWDAATMDGGSGNGTMSARQLILPKLLFMLDELAAQGIVLKGKDVISVEPGEAYRLDNAEPIDDISVTWIVTQVKAKDTENLPLPGDIDG